MESTTKKYAAKMNTVTMTMLVVDLDLAARGRNHLTHLGAHILQELNGPLPGCDFSRSNGVICWSATVIVFAMVVPQIFKLVNRLEMPACRDACLPRGRSERKLAGELGFEPRSSVLETDSLTVELTPP